MKIKKKYNIIRLEKNKLANSPIYYSYSYNTVKLMVYLKDLKGFLYMFFYFFINSCWGTSKKHLVLTVNKGKNHFNTWNDSEPKVISHIMSISKNKCIKN